MLPTNVIILSLVGGLVLSGLGAAAQKMSETTITVKTIGRDFFAGSLIVIVLGFLIPDSFKDIALMFPASFTFPTSLGLTSSNVLEIQVDPRL